MERPTGITILAVLSFIAAGLTLLIALGALAGGALLTTMLSSMPTALVGAGVIIVAVFCFFFAALYAVNGWGLLKLQNWARILTIVLIALGLLSAGLGALSALAHFRIAFLIRELIVVGLDVWILLYLLKPHVKQAFGATGF
jgi:hypothetical protein